MRTLVLHVSVSSFAVKVYIGGFPWNDIGCKERGESPDILGTNILGRIMSGVWNRNGYWLSQECVLSVH